MSLNTSTLQISIAAVTCLCTSCGGTGNSRDLIFVDGRAVAAAGDSLLAMTRMGTTGIIVRDRRTGAVFTRATNVLRTPHHVQAAGGKWYVSDIEERRAIILVFSDRWELESRIDVASVASAPHQFAVLPDGRLLVEAGDGRLVTITPDSVATFAVVDQSNRTGLLVAALGGVVHAVPNETITLYNALGHIRWRQPWPWHEGAFVTDLAVDAHGRVHVLGGEEDTDVFVAFSLSPITGEVVRWSVPGRSATFVVDRLGEILPDSATRWIGG